MNSKDFQILDLYSDYLISSFSLVTATNMACVLDDRINHDQITRFLANNEFDSKTLWKIVKPVIRQIESESEGIIIIDDVIEKKEWTDENDIIAWHFDHVEDRSVKGINIVNCLYHNQEITLPVNYRIIKKDISTTNPKTGKTVRKCAKTKNEIFRELLLMSDKGNQIKFRYAVADVWFSSVENMIFVKKDLHKDFIFPLKSNRLVALSLEDKLAGKWQSVSKLSLESEVTYSVYIKGADFPVLLMKKVFKNQNGQESLLYLVTSDLSISSNQILKNYQKRWKIEEYHKSLKQNTALAKSPTRTVRTQSNHCFASMYAYCKLEMLKVQTKLNHFSLKTKIYLVAIKKAFQELRKLKASNRQISLVLASA
jgi:hypothetical protein